MDILENSPTEVAFGSVKDVSNLTGISPSHLKKLRLYSPEKSPTFFHVGRKVLYPLNGPRGLASWADARMQAGSAR